MDKNLKRKIKTAQLQMPVIDNIGKAEMYLSRKISEASEIVEIIDNGEQKQSDGYINDDIIEENNNIFVIIVKAISSFIKAIFQTILNIISKLVSSISSFKCI